MRVRLEERLAALAAAANTSPANRIEWGDRSLGIIAEGIAYQYVREIAPEASVLKIGWVWPFPDELIREFAAGVRRLLIVEELDPILEEHVRSLGIACEGRSLVPGIGELSPDRLAGMPWARSDAERPPRTCADCGPSRSARPFSVPPAPTGAFSTRWASSTWPSPGTSAAIRWACFRR